MAGEDWKWVWITGIVCFTFIAALAIIRNVPASLTASAASGVGVAIGARGRIS